MAYIPKSKLNIQETNGTDFQNIKTKKPYFGKYMQLSNGKIFAGTNPTNPGPELESLENIKTSYGNKDVVTHRNLNPTISRKVNSYKSIPYAKNIPTDDDYEQGFFNRHFMKKVNEPFGYKEISKETYDSIKQGKSEYDINLYKADKIKWHLRGNVKKLNKSILNQHTKINPNLFIIYPQLDEFNRPEIVNNQFAYPGQMYYLNDFTKEYVGAYHIHPSKGPMVGAKHSPLYHERLVFAEDRRKLKSNEKFLANAKKLDKLAREKSIKVDGLAKYILSGENEAWYSSTRKKSKRNNRSIEEQAAREAAWFIDNKESTQVEEILSKNVVLPTSTKNTNTISGENMSSEGSGGGSSIASGTSGGGGGGY